MVRLTGGILAGGKSSRFGSNKALFRPTDGESFIEHSIGLLKQFCNELLISVSNDNIGDYQTLLSQPEVSLVKDIHPDKGPLGGIESLLTASPNKWMLIVTCDMPYMNATTLSQMMERLKKESAVDGIKAIAWRTDTGNIKPFPMLIHQDTLTNVSQRIKDQRLRIKEMLEDVHTQWLTITDKSAFVNVNRREDYPLQ